MTTAEAADFLAELVSQFLHADTLITEQAERIETGEAEIARLKAGSDQTAAA